MHQGNTAGSGLHDYVVLRDRPGDDSWIEPVQRVAGAQLPQEFCPQLLGFVLTATQISEGLGEA
jgi:hypothetical protein